MTEAGISAAQGRESWRSEARKFAGFLGTLVVGLLVLVKVAIELSPRQGRSFKVPLVEGVADGVGRVGTWVHGTCPAGCISCHSPSASGST